MRDTDYTSLRREFLGAGITSAMVGLAGCTDSIDLGITGTNDDEMTGSSSGAESSQTTLSIINFNLTKSDTKELQISLKASESLSSVRVSLSGPESTTFSKNDFAETQTGSKEYTYQTTYQINSPGDYEAILNQAADDEDNTIRDNRAVTVSVEPVSVQWSYQTEDVILSSPAWWDNKIYFGSYDNNVYALDASTGEEEWVFETDGEVGSSPLAIDGTIYIGSRDQKLYSLDAETGEEQWVFNANDDVYYFDKVTSTIYVGGYGEDGSRLFAVDVASGSQQWSYAGGEAGIIEVGAGTVYNLTGDSLHAVDTRTGEQEWRIGTQGGEALTLGDDALYFGSYGGEGLYSLDPDTGETNWQVESIMFPYPTEYNGIVYVGANSGAVYALDSLSGGQEWVWNGANGGVNTYPVVANGNLYVGSEDNNAYALSIEDGTKKWEFETGGHVDATVTAVNDSIYIPSENNTLYSVVAPFSNQ